MSATGVVTHRQRCDRPWGITFLAALGPPPLLCWALAPGMPLSGGAVLHTAWLVILLALTTESMLSMAPSDPWLCVLSAAGGMLQLHRHLQHGSPQCLCKRRKVPNRCSLRTPPKPAVPAEVDRGFIPRCRAALCCRAALRRVCAPAP